MLLRADPMQTGAALRDAPTSTELFQMEYHIAYYHKVAVRAKSSKW
jgi:hypothetical protein